MSSPSIVRPAGPADEPEIWRLFNLMHKENGLFKMSVPKVQYYLDRVLYPEKIAGMDAGPRGFIGVIGAAGALEGVIMLVLGAAWYSDEISLDDAVNFVDPAHRESNHAKALIAYAKHMVDEVRLGHPTFRMIVGVLSTKRTAAKIRLYERMQLAPIGAFFAYPPPADFEPLKGTFFRQ